MVHSTSQNCTFVTETERLLLTAFFSICPHLNVQIVANNVTSSVCLKSFSPSRFINIYLLLTICQWASIQNIKLFCCENIGIEHTLQATASNMKRKFSKTVLMESNDLELLVIEQDN